MTWHTVAACESAAQWKRRRRRSRGRQQQQPHELLSSFRKWPVALVHYTKNTTPAAPSDVRSASQGCDPPAMATQTSQGVPQRGVVDLLAGPHPQWRKQNLAASKQQVALFCRKVLYCTACRIHRTTKTAVYIQAASPEGRRALDYCRCAARPSPSSADDQITNRALGPAFFCFFLFSFGFLLGG